MLAKKLYLTAFAICFASALIYSLWPQPVQANHTGAETVITDKRDYFRKQ